MLLVVLFLGNLFAIAEIDGEEEYSFSTCNRSLLYLNLLILNYSNVSELTGPLERFREAIKSFITLISA